jgi:hypothetical protein
MVKLEKGKGGLFDTRPNPFGYQKGTHIAPTLTESDNLGRVFDAVCGNGCALILGHTRDGGALVITVLDGDQRHRTYCSNDNELAGALDALWVSYGPE